MGLMFLTMWAVAFQAANGQPTLNWERQYDLNGAEDIFNAVEVSSTRSVYLAGYGKHTSTGFEYVMVKYYYTGQCSLRCHGYMQNTAVD